MSSYKVHKCGSEHNTAYLYKRSKRVNSCGTQAATPSVLEAFLEPAWSDDAEVRKLHYEALRDAAYCKLPSGTRLHR